MRIEIAWILLVLIGRIYKSPSQYLLQTGSSLIVIISNRIDIACEYHKKGFLSFGSSISLVCAACLPAILSLYVFFIFEFGINDDHYKETMSDSITAVFLIFTSFAWLLFGMFIPIMLDNIKNNKIKDMT